MSDFLAVCGECHHLKPNLHCPVQGHVRKYDRVICEHFEAKDKAVKIRRPICL